MNLSGQVIGINVAGTGERAAQHRVRGPINEALIVARQIEANHAG